MEGLLRLRLGGGGEQDDASDQEGAREHDGQRQTDVQQPQVLVGRVVGEVGLGVQILKQQKETPKTAPDRQNGTQYLRHGRRLPQK